MRRFVSLLFALILLAANTAMAGGQYLPDSTANFPPSIRDTISQLGSMTISPSEETRITTTIEGLSVFAFVRVTNHGFNIFDCWEHGDNARRVCSRKLEVTINEGGNKAEALFSILNWQRYSLVAVDIGDTATIKTMKPHASIIEPYNSDGEGGHRFASKGEFAIVRVILE